MNSARRWCVVLCAIALVAGAVPALASQAAAAARLDQRPTQVRGELLRVNSKARTLTIKADEGTEMAFRYTDRTEVTGAEQGVAGLATMKGVNVTVYFEVDASGQSLRKSGEEPIRTATKIEVHPRK